jgi:hypothetical protein
MLRMLDLKASSSPASDDSREMQFLYIGRPDVLREVKVACLFEAATVMHEMLDKSLAALPFLAEAVTSSASASMECGATTLMASILSFGPSATAADLHEIIVAGCFNIPVYQDIEESLFVIAKRATDPSVRGLLSTEDLSAVVTWIANQCDAVSMIAQGKAEVDKDDGVSSDDRYITLLGDFLEDGSDDIREMATQVSISCCCCCCCAFVVNVVVDHPPP